MPEDLRPLATSALAEIDASLEPASKDDCGRHLTACLMLVAPSGMGEIERREWLRVAWGTVRHLPADLLAIGAEQARKTADHPAKIVSTIISATESAMAMRRAERSKVARLLAKRTPRPWESEGEPFDPSTKPTPEQRAAIKAEFGIQSDEPAKRTTFDKPPRAPTRDDYIAMGVDPATLDSSMTNTVSEGAR